MKRDLSSSEYAQLLTLPSIPVATSRVIPAPTHLLQSSHALSRFHSQNFDSVYATAPLKIFKGFPLAYRIKFKALSLAFKTLCSLLSLALTSLENLVPTLLLCLLLFPCLAPWLSCCQKCLPPSSTIPARSSSLLPLLGSFPQLPCSNPLNFSGNYLRFSIP